MIQIGYCKNYFIKLKINFNSKILGAPSENLPKLIFSIEPLF